MGSVGLLVLAMVSIQAGAAFAQTLFPRIGPEGATGLRLIFAAGLMNLAFRPWRRFRAGRPLAALLGYGLALGAMNTLFYHALTTVPMGVAIALEFIGPLGVAAWGSRRPRDIAWLVLATGGLLLLLPLWNGGAAPVDPVGALYALGSGVCWGVYILLGRKAGADHGADAAPLGMLIAALAFAPLGLLRAGPAVLALDILPAAAFLGLLSSALPYALEMIALRRLPTRVFGILMSLEPAVGALAGLVLLHQRPGLAQTVGIGLVMVAALGVAATA